MDPEDLLPALDGHISSGDILHHGGPHHGESLLAQQRLRDLGLLLEHGDGLLEIDGPFQLHGDLLVAIRSVGNERDRQKIYRIILLLSDMESNEFILLHVSKGFRPGHSINVHINLPSKFGEFVIFICNFSGKVSMYVPYFKVT